MNLAKAWLDVTEDPEEANYQKERVYWKRICEKFLFLERKEEGYRQPDNLSSKWRKMRPQIQAFNQIYGRRSRANNHQSGESDADVIKSCLQEYQGIYGKPFTFLPIWDKIRNSSKFHYVVDFDVRTSRGQPSSKRSKTSSSSEPQSQGSDARVNFDLNSFDVEDDGPVFQERARGRDAARRASCGGSSGSADKGKGKYAETFESLSGKLDGLMDISKERLGLGKEKMELEKLKAADRQNVIKLAEYKILTADYSHLAEPQRSIMMKAQQDLLARHGARN